MARIVVDVMLKPEILDPQGKAISHELPRIALIPSWMFARVSASS